MQIVLASTSPRRIQLLGQVLIPVEVVSPLADEKARPGEKPEALVKRLSREKAESVAADIARKHQSALIIAADTIVVSPGGKVLGKPRDGAEARKMLSSLAGKTHTVLTGYTLIAVREKSSRPKEVSRVVRSRVKMRPMTRRAIERYVASGEPMDKAGSYAAQGLGMGLIESIQGSYTNVVGLPISQLLLDLERHFDLPLFDWVP